MSFRCDFCQQAQPSGVKPQKVTVEVRKISYNTIFEYEGKSKDSFGQEIVKEINLCPVCDKVYEFDADIVGIKTVIQRV